MDLTDSGILPQPYGEHVTLLLADYESEHCSRCTIIITIWFEVFLVRKCKQT